MSQQITVELPEPQQEQLATEVAMQVGQTMERTQQLQTELQQTQQQVQQLTETIQQQQETIQQLQQPVIVMEQVEQVEQVAESNLEPELIQPPEITATEDQAPPELEKPNQPETFMHKAVNWLLS